MIKLGSNFFDPWESKDCMEAFVARCMDSFKLDRYPRNIHRYCEAHMSAYLDFASNYASGLDDAAGDDLRDSLEDR